MKRQIAEFLGELAEELGWKPEHEDQRVRLEPQPATPVGILNISPTSQPPDPPPVSSSPPDLHKEVRHLRSSLNHLSSEVTYLRAEMARLKKLPAPPDSQPAPSTAAESRWTPTVAESKRTTPNASGMGEVRPWPAHLVPQPAPTPASPVGEAAVQKPEHYDPLPADPLPDQTLETLRETVPVEPPPEPVSTEPPQDTVAVAVEPPRARAFDTPREPLPAEPEREPVAVEPPRAPESTAVTEIDADSPLELFPSEPTSAKDPGPATPVP